MKHRRVEVMLSATQGDESMTRKTCKGCLHLHAKAEFPSGINGAEM